MEGAGRDRCLRREKVGGVKKKGGGGGEDTAALRVVIVGGGGGARGNLLRHTSKNQPIAAERCVYVRVRVFVWRAYALWNNGEKYWRAHIYIPSYLRYHY